MKLENKDIFLSIDGVCDKKSKLNKLNKRVNPEYLEQIEEGVTLEELDGMRENGLPVLKYKTQITVHGLFPDLNNQVVFGYVNVFQNKNKSIGIKYNAIDEEKRRRIADRLKILGYHYSRTSSDFKYMKSERLHSKDEYLKKIEEFKREVSKIDTSLFYGGVQAYGGNYMGIYFVFIELHIGAIYERNIEPLLNSMGATLEALESHNKQKEEERKKREAQYEEERKNKQALRDKILSENSEELERLKQYPEVTKHEGCGVFVKPRFNYKDELVYEVFYIYGVKGKKKPRYNKSEYLTLDEALNHDVKTGWSDNIWNGKVSGYRIT